MGGVYRIHTFLDFYKKNYIFKAPKWLCGANNVNYKFMLLLGALVSVLK